MTSYFLLAASTTYDSPCNLLSTHFAASRRSCRPISSWPHSTWSPMHASTLQISGAVLLYSLFYQYGSCRPAGPRKVPVARQGSENSARRILSGMMRASLPPSNCCLPPCHVVMLQGAGPAGAGPVQCVRHHPVPLILSMGGAAGGGGS